MKAKNSNQSGTQNDSINTSISTKMLPEARLKASISMQQFQGMDTVKNAKTDFSVKKGLVSFKSQQKAVGERFREDDSEPEDFTRALENTQQSSPSKSGPQTRLSPLEYLNDMERRSYFFTRLRQRLDSRPEPNPMLKKYLEQPENYLHKTANQITSTVVRLAGL